MLTIDAIPAFADNYIWCISNSDDNCAFVVDPGDATPVIEYLNTNALTLSGILITHHHPDHTGGISTLKKAYDCVVFGPENSNITGIDKPLSEGDIIDCLGHNCHIIDIPGHTLDHIAYFFDRTNNTPRLFCGDTLFAGGCGRIFEGTPAQMLSSLKKLAMLPIETEVYCAHEYTQANLHFAITVEPDNIALQQRCQDIDKLRSTGIITLPSNLALELSTNPFLRCQQIDLLATAKRYNKSAETELDVFTAIRTLKNNF